MNSQGLSFGDLLAATDIQGYEPHMTLMERDIVNEPIQVVAARYCPVPDDYFVVPLGLNIHDSSVVSKFWVANHTLHIEVCSKFVQQFPDSDMETVYMEGDVILVSAFIPPTTKHPLLSQGPQCVDVVERTYAALKRVYNKGKVTIGEADWDFPFWNLVADFLFRHDAPWRFWV